MNEYITRMWMDGQISQAEHDYMQHIYSEAERVSNWAKNTSLSQNAKSILDEVLSDLF